MALHAADARRRRDRPPHLGGPAALGPPDLATSGVPPPAASDLDAPLAEWTKHRWVQCVLVDDVSCVLHADRRRADPRPLEAVRGILLDWMFVPGKPSRFSPSPFLALLWFVSGLLLLMLTARRRGREDGRGAARMRECTMGMPLEVRHVLGNDADAAAAPTLLA